MLPKERVITQLKHHETDFIPYAFLDFEGDVAERLDARYGGPAWRGRICNHIRHVPGMKTAIPNSPGPRVRDQFGSLWRMDLRPHHLEETALKRPSFDGYHFPTLDDFIEPGWQEDSRAEADRLQDLFLIVGFGFGLFERTWTLRGFENVLTDSLAEPAFYEELVARVADLQTQIIAQLVTLPVDGIMFSDDWGDQRGVLLGPDNWRRYIKPHLAKMYDLVHRAGKFTLSHCCGCITDLLPDLIEIGLDCLQSIQPEAMDPYDLKRRYGRDITLWGGLGSQRVIPFGTPDEIRAEVDKLCRVMGQGGGYILGPAKALQPETPTDNAAAVVEAFLDQAGESVAGP